MRVAIMGAGGQGCFFGACLANAGNDVTFIARKASLEALRAKGVMVKSNTLGDFTTRVKASDDPAEVGPVDLIMLSVKYYDLEEAASHMIPLIGSDAAVVPVVNGVDVAERVGGIVGGGHVLGGLSWVNTRLESPGVVSHGGLVKLVFGELGGGYSPRTRRLETVFRGARIDAELSADVKTAIWEKFVANGALSGIMTLTRLPAGPLRDSPEVWALLRRALEEATAVAQAYGVKLPPGYIDGTLESFTGYAPWAKAAMLQDIEAGRRLELDALTGAVVRLGRERGVPTPLNDIVYAALRPYREGAPRVS